MNRYALIDDLMNFRSSHCGFWHGNPHPESMPKLKQYFGVNDDFELGEKLGSSFWWVPNGWCGYSHPDGDGFFDIYKEKNGWRPPHLSELTDDDVDLVEKMNWSDVKYLDFSNFQNLSARAKESGTPVFSGMWAPFYHNVADLFGMENYFVKMHSDPELVHAITEKVAGFYIECNEVFFKDYAKNLTASFFGNDFGTQIDLMISPSMFKTFVMPHQKKLAEQAKRYGLYSCLHSCGSVVKAIPEIIDAGINGLHPVQALAAGMDAENLSAKFKDKIVFIGAVDTQVLLREGSAAAVRDEVKRLKDLFGKNFIISPSHEAVLPDVPPENLAAIAEEAHK